MERILVTMNGRSAAMEALSRSLALASRIEARLFVLVVTPASGKKKGIDRNFLQDLERRIKSANETGIHVDLFFSEGNYEQEVIKFAENHKITLIVTEHDGPDGAMDHKLASLRMIRHRVSCRVEIVSPRKITPKGDGI